MPLATLSDASLSYQVEGVGQPVLLIQGVGLGGCGWKPQVDGLRDRFQLLSYDHRGIGGSSLPTSSLSVEQMADDARSLLDQMGWESGHVVGHSMGGLIAQQLALTHPKRVRSLALLCTFSRGLEGAGLTPWMVWVGLRCQLGTKAMRRAAFLEIVLPPADLVGADRAKLAADLAPVFGHDLAVQPAVAMKQVRAMAKHNQFERLSELASIPTLVMSGAHDKLARPEYGRRLAAKIPGARYVEVDDAAHGLPIQRASVTNQYLAQHFESDLVPAE